MPLDKIKRNGDIYKPYNENMKRTSLDISNDAVKYLISAVAMYKERFGDKDDPQEQAAYEEIHDELLKVHGELNPS